MEMYLILLIIIGLCIWAIIETPTKKKPPIARRNGKPEIDWPDYSDPVAQIYHVHELDDPEIYDPEHPERYL